jgi:hypothetical protein
MRAEIVLPQAKNVHIQSVKLNLECEVCGRTWGKTCIDNEGGQYILDNGWAVCTRCAERIMNGDDNEQTQHIQKP